MSHHTEGDDYDEALSISALKGWRITHRLPREARYSHLLEKDIHYLQSVAGGAVSQGKTADKTYLGLN